MNVIFRTDSSTQIGIGHLSRCLTLADKLKSEGVGVAFICRELPGNICDFIENKGYKVHRLAYSKTQSDNLERFNRHAEWLGENWETDAKQTINVLVKEEQEIDWLIIDHYALGEEWEQQIRPYAKKIMVIDDLADRPHDCDLLLDQNLFGDMRTRYEGLVPEHCQKLLGPNYALLRSEFAEARNDLRERDGKVRRILVFFGGADPANETEKALKAIQMLDRPDIAIDVIVGNANPHKESIKKTCSTIQNATYYCQVDNIAQLMAEADLSIGAGGTATWERCCLGLPSLLISIAENQLNVIESLSRDGFVINGGWHEDTTVDELLKDLSFLLKHPEILRTISLNAKELVDGKGAERVQNSLLNDLNFMHLRSAGQDDRKQVFEWRNHPDTREHIFNPSPINWNEHKKWFTKALTSTDMELLIGEIRNEPVGVVRYDFNDNRAFVSVYAVPGHSGGGIGTRLIKEGNSWVKKNHPRIKRIIAEIKRQNTSSVRAFQKAGYRESHLTYYYDING